MWNHPIVQREFIGTLRQRRAAAALIATALAFSALVLLGWPSDAQVDLTGAPAQKVFRLFGYGLLAALLLLAPAFPATSIVREKQRGTLILLLNSPLRPWSIYLGKLAGSLGFVLLLLLTSVPAAAACFAMGGISLGGELLPLYALLTLVAVQYTAWALLVSTYVNSNDAALRIHHKHHPPHGADQPMPLVGDQALRTGTVEQAVVQTQQGQRRKQSAGHQSVRHAADGDVPEGHQALGAHAAVPQ